MEYLKEYRISRLNITDIEEYTLQMLRAFNIYLSDEEYIKNNINNYLNDYIFLGARLNSNDSIIGGVCFDLHPNYYNQIYIENLFVEKNYRNYGVASTLINYIILNKNSFFNGKNIDLYLFCREELQSFYEKENFSLEKGSNSNKIIKMIRKI